MRWGQSQQDSSIRSVRPARIDVAMGAALIAAVAKIQLQVRRRLRCKGDCRRSHQSDTQERPIFSDRTLNPSY